MCFIGTCWSLKTSNVSPWLQRCLRGYLHPGRTWRSPSCHCVSAADTPPPGPLYQRAAETGSMELNRNNEMLWNADVCTVRCMWLCMICLSPPAVQTRSLADHRASWSQEKCTAVAGGRAAQRLIMLHNQGGAAIVQSFDLYVYDVMFLWCCN